jgi:hypothetical protein
MDPVGVGVSGRVEPVAAPMFAPSGRGEQAVDEPLVGALGGVLDERLDLGGVGGSPVRSRLRRRASVRRSASGAGVRPFSSSFASTKRSIGVRTHAPSFTAGGSGRFGAMNDQWG